MSGLRVHIGDDLEDKLTKSIRNPLRHFTNLINVKYFDVKKVKISWYSIIVLGNPFHWETSEKSGYGLLGYPREKLIPS